MSSPFSERIRHHPRIAVTSSPGTLRGRDVLAVKDQLLVCTGPRGGHALSRHVADWLSAHGIDHRTRTTVFAGLQPPGSQDADVFELRLPVATDIFHVTEGLRTALAGELKGQPGRISPNHVLVPAMDDHSCPNGPPVPSGSPLPGSLYGQPAGSARILSPVPYERREFLRLPKVPACRFG